LKPAPSVFSIVTERNRESSIFQAFHRKKRLFFSILTETFIIFVTLEYILKPLDKIDQELIAFLIEDGRATLTELGEKLVEIKGEKMSHVAVQKRLQKLVEQGLIKIQANSNVTAFEQISAFILVETKDYEAQRRIIERFRLCPRVVFMDLISGKYNIIIRVMAPCLKELECFLNYSWLKHEEGVRNLDMYISTTNVKPRFLPMPMTSSCNKASDKAPCGYRCNMCDLYKKGECKGCPATKFPEQNYVSPQEQAYSS
jgi:DNA-binding Lrp family transcriptional regulator